jgi:hypothetical protein
LVLAVAVGLLLFRVAVLAPYWVAVISYPFQIDDTEGVILAESKLLSQGINIYQPVRQDFFTAAPYPPVLYLVNTLAVKWLGPTFKVGRVLSLLAGLGIAFVLWRIVWILSDQAAASFLAPAVFLSNPIVAVWMVRLRPDMAGILLCTVGMALIVWGSMQDGAYGRGGLRYLIGPVAAKLPGALTVAALVMAVGFYIKHTLVAAPLAVFLWLVIGKPQQAFNFLAVYVAAVTVPYVALDILTNGGFSQHLISFHSNWSSARALNFWGDVLNYFWPLLPIAVLGGLVASFGQTSSLISIYSLITVATASMVGTEGGNHNHFLEFSMALALTSSFGLTKLLSSERTFVCVLALAGSILVTYYAFIAIAPPNWLIRELRVPSESEREGWINITQYVTNFRGEVFSDNVGLLVLAGKPLRYTDPFTMAMAYRNGQWSDAALVEELRNAKFGLVVLRQDLTKADTPAGDLTPGVFQAIKEHYRIVERNVEFIYAPYPEE